MQSIFRLPWCSDALGIDASKPDIMALQQKQPQRQTSVVEIPLLNKLKRKRSDSAGPLDLSLDRDVKRNRPSDADLQLSAVYDQWQESDTVSRRDSHDAATDIKTDSATSPASPASASRHAPPSNTMDDGAPLASSYIVKPELSLMQQTIEHQFNLEIMVKHRELRLIEQELAKCQTALEQLRRCEIIPFPGHDGPSSDVSAGTGSAVRAPAGHSQPAAPAPWGVTDGPYTRHYSQWLMPDPAFDSVAPVQSVQQDQSAIRGDGRPVRNSFGAWAKPVKSRSQRESISFSAAESVPAAPAAPARNKGGPLVLKRMSDNQYVKLVCTKCHRSDFSSVQGFLNHCRIAHKIDYKSHEAAAQDCGHVLEDHEAELAATAPPPVGSAVRAATAPKPAPPPPVVVSRVHHLNHDTIPRPTWKSQRQAYIDAINRQQTAPVATMTTDSTYHADGPMVPAESQPFLSAHLARQGKHIDLAAIVAKLGEKIDLGPEPEDVDDTSTPGEATPSRKGFNQAGNRPRPAPLHATRSVGSPEPSEDLNEHNLSPRTSDSNPGLVSDHDDSDPEDEASVIVSRDELHIPQGCGDAMDLDLVVDDDHRDHAILIRPRDSLQSDGDLSVASPSRVRSKYGRRD